MSIGLCKRCSQRHTCEALCPDAEKYADQDYTTFPAPIYLRDQTVQPPKPTDMTWADMQGSAPELGRDEWEIVESIPWITEHQKDCLRRYYWERSSLRTIAVQMNLNPVTVMRLIKKAQASLRRYLWAYLRIEEIKRPGSVSVSKVGRSFAKVNPKEQARGPKARTDQGQGVLFH